MSKYAITIQNKGESRVETVEGVKALRTNLELFKKQGWTVDDISRVVA